MPFYAGFDIKQYPGSTMMDWLSSNTNLKWCGYYLAPAPNRPPSGWNGQYGSISGGWGVLPVYVGQQDPLTAKGTYVPSSILTADQGAIDGSNAADLAAGDGFPHGTVVYLDWEQGDLNGDGAGDYIKAWINAVVADGRIAPGIYCSHNVAQAIVNLIDTINPTPDTRFWCWMVTQGQHVFTGDLSQIPEIDPTGCGFGGAQSWQREQDATVTFPAGAPVKTLRMDFSTSSLQNPGAPAGVAPMAVELEAIAPVQKRRRAVAKKKAPAKKPTKAARKPTATKVKKATKPKQAAKAKKATRSAKVASKPTQKKAKKKAKKKTVAKRKK